MTTRSAFFATNPACPIGAGSAVAAAANVPGTSRGLGAERPTIPAQGRTSMGYTTVRPSFTPLSRACWMPVGAFCGWN